MSARTRFASLCLVLVGGAISVVAAEPIPQKIEFNRDIRPILSDNCFHCHGPAKNYREGDLRLDVAAGAFGEREGAVAVVPKDLDASDLWARVSSTDEELVMPPVDSSKTLTPREVQLLKLWIEQGAPWQSHWSFEPLRKPPVPDVAAAPPRQPIDVFVEARAAQAGLGPAPPADRETLIRRVTFDLTGLPPTLAEIDAFVSDKSVDAYETVVDRLLASEHYGERMALAWLDAARYGDTSVFHADGPRDMWPWRNWVIRAYNNNMPFNQFTIEQIGGDLIPSATVDQKTASGFNRNHGTTDEGGVIAEEYRVEYVVDRVKTTSTVWLGMTLECGQCHEHKYDPFDQKEYYQLYAFFNQTSDGGMQTRNGNAQPVINIPNLVGEQKAKALDARIAAIDEEFKQRIESSEPAFRAWLDGASAKAAADGTSLLPGNMLAHFPLDETKGRKVANLVADTQPGKVNGKPQWTEGKYNGAFQADGKNFVDLGNVGDFERTDKFSYGAWLYIDGDSTGAPLARMDSGNGHRGYDLYITARRPTVHIINTWPGDALKVNCEQQIPAKEWHHVFVTYDGSSKTAGIKIYVDGKEQKWKVEQDRLKNSIRTDKTLYLGRRNPGAPFKGLVDDVRVYPRMLTQAEVQSLAGQDPIGPLLATPAAERTAEQIATLKNHYLNSQDKPYQELTAEQTKLKAETTTLRKPLSTVMVMQEMPKPRMTYVLDRGHYGSPRKDEVINAETPAFLPPMKEGLPKNRLGLAKWIVDDENPLTARVAVNRYWQMLFGNGIVETPDDFGSQGQWPSHPELLDWLAKDFVESGWNVKRMLKQIVMSNTYRQSSRITKEKYAADSNNRLLSRGPRFRLQGEFLRDNALAVSGLLVNQVGGPSVKPYQPPGLWFEVSLSGARFKQDAGDKLYRRSMYTYWKRSAPAPSMRIFDAPTREKCVIKRQRTNTPLQALVTLNDPQFVEAARFLAERMMKEGGATPQERIEYAYRLATSRRPRPAVASVLLEAYQQELTVFKKESERAETLLAVGDRKRDATLDAAEHAAWTIVASMILNLDETITRG